MTTHVHLPTILRPYAAGARVVEATGSTVAEVFDNLNRRYPRLVGQLLDPAGGLPIFVNVFVEDEDIRYLDGMATRVEDGGRITILPAVAGG